MELAHTQELLAGLAAVVLLQMQAAQALAVRVLLAVQEITQVHFQSAVAVVDQVLLVQMQTQKLGEVMAVLAHQTQLLDRR
jgi:hypothetical protein